MEATSTDVNIASLEARSIAMMEGVVGAVSLVLALVHHGSP
jgi:hypothetical protein